MVDKDSRPSVTARLNDGVFSKSPEPDDCDHSSAIVQPGNSKSFCPKCCQWIPAKEVAQPTPPPSPKGRPKKNA